MQEEGAEHLVRIPLSAKDIYAAAAARGLTIPDACMPAVTANLALLASHAARVLDPDSSVPS